MITIIDYDSGNIGSIVNMIKSIGFESTVVRDSKGLDGASAIILPGVGSFDTAIEKLNKSEMFSSIINKVTINKIPILGICLGMQLLTKGSEEGDGLKGLGLVDAHCFKFNTKGLKVPHMGWNEVHVKKNSIYFDTTIQERFYFAHSYAVTCKNKADILTTTTHGHNFTSSFLHGNVLGVQFHPEKSHSFGKKFFESFLKDIDA